MVKVYLIGKITGREEEEWKGEFQKVEMVVRGWWDKKLGDGVEVLNPVFFPSITNKVCTKEDIWGKYIMQGLEILGDCDLGVVVGDIAGSRGAEIEIAFCKGKGIPVVKII